MTWSQTRDLNAQIYLKYQSNDKSGGTTQKT